MTPQALKRAIANLIDDFCVLNKEVSELREHNRYLESRVSEVSDYSALLASHNAIAAHMEHAEKHIECQTAENYLLADCLCLEYHECVGALARHNALVEAASWERACQGFTYRSPMSIDAMKELLRTKCAARAEVDRLIGEGEG